MNHLVLIDPVGRDQARELARRELEKPIYHRDEPSVLDRLLNRISEWLDSLFRTLSGQGERGTGGGWIALIVVIGLLILVIAAIMWRIGAVRRTAARRGALLDTESTSAEDHRAAAERYAAAGEWADAIRERLRAISRDLEERAILTPRPGRTADELAAEASAALPDLTARFTTAVGIFDDVWYGDRPGTAEGYALLTELDEQVRTAKPRPLEPAS